MSIVDYMVENALPFSVEDDWIVMDIDKLNDKSIAKSQRIELYEFLKTKQYKWVRLSYTKFKFYETSIPCNNT
jgi:hypothetical protein